MTDDDDILGFDAPLPGITIEKLRKLVEQIPNDDVPYESNDHDTLAWLQMMLAIAHQTGKSAEGKEIAREWSEKSAKHQGDESEERFEKTWAAQSSCRTGGIRSPPGTSSSGPGSTARRAPRNSSRRSTLRSKLQPRLTI